jgi:hypothetical protein
VESTMLLKSLGVVPRRGQAQEGHSERYSGEAVQKCKRGRSTPREVNPVSRSRVDVVRFLALSARSFQDGAATKAARECSTRAAVLIIIICFACFREFGRKMLIYLTKIRVRPPIRRRVFQNTCYCPC